MLKKITFICISLLFLNSYAKEVVLTYDKLTLNANFSQVDNWRENPVLLITHGTLFHNKSELISNLQTLFAENEMSSLAINLSLGLNNRHGAYECATPHTHKHEDAVDEIGLWVKWLKKQGANNIVLVGHSRGGNQTAWFASEREDSTISKIILIAPQLWSPDYVKEGYKKSFNKDLSKVLKKAETLLAEGKPTSMMKPVDFIYCKETKATAEAFISYYNPDMRKDTLFLLPKIKKPTLIFAGTDDKVVINLEQKFSTINSQDNIKLEVLEGADHSFRDLYTDEIVEFSVEFINSTQ